MVEIIYTNPDRLGEPLGQYSQVTRVRGSSEFLFIAGQVGLVKAGEFSNDFGAQCEATFANTLAALEDCGADWSNVVQFTTYLIHSQDIPKFMDYRLKAFPGFFPKGKYPPNTLLMIDRLVQERFLIEVQTVAAL